MSIGDAGKPPLKRKLIGFRKQQVTCREGEFIGNRSRNIGQDIIGIRGIMTFHLQVMDIVDDCRKIIVILFYPFLTIVPRSKSIRRKLRFKAIRLNRKWNGVFKIIRRSFHCPVRLMTREIRGILRPCLRIAVPVSFLDVSRHEFNHRTQRIANVADKDRGRILGKGIRSHSEGREHNQLLPHRG